MTCKKTYKQGNAYYFFVPGKAHGFRINNEIHSARSVVEMSIKARGSTSKIRSLLRIFPYHRESESNGFGSNDYVDYLLLMEGIMLWRCQFIDGI